MDSYFYINEFNSNLYIYYYMAPRGPLVMLFLIYQIPYELANTSWFNICQIYLYPSRLLHWHLGNHMVVPVPTKHPWRIWANVQLVWIDHNYNKTKHSKVVNIFHGTYCTPCITWDQSVHAPSHWEAMLYCNGVSHWLGPSTKWSLYNMGIYLRKHSMKVNMALWWLQQNFLYSANSLQTPHSSANKGWNVWYCFWEHFWYMSCTFLMVYCTYFNIQIAFAGIR